MKKNKRLYILGGFFAIVIVYSLYNIYLVDVNYYEDIPRKVRHINRFLSILIVYGIGFYTFKKYDVPWIRTLWNIIYILFLSLLILIGIYDWSLGPASGQIRNIANTFHEFLISPILYVAILIINNTLVKIGQKNREIL